MAFTAEMLISVRENNSAQVSVRNDGKLSLGKIVSAEGQFKATGAVPAGVTSANIAGCIAEASQD
ncbi:hypothetical protein [Crossiella cryophila]|uniref:Uncharacterized protein n=1 Tax=Crossiella cryophila TaxID=43355 RepID=A0A7W7C7Z7_9PSEU|nr:hypothetical protein [Crossiella cryophila]MBB4676127.1 hypothetical protein [Crossiella cryophila]